MSGIEIILEDDRWIGLEERAQVAWAGICGALALNDDFEVSILGCDDARIAVLNGDFRDKPAATNVLSWPSVERAAETPGTVPTPPDMSDPELGDIAIAYDTCAREAVEHGKRFEDHVTHLLVHGILHLLGYDHETAQDAALMEGLETQILAKQGIEDPY